MFEDPKRTKKYLKVALQGGAKVGKTRLALSFPDPHVVDGERGSDAYVEKYGFHVRHTNRWKGLGEELTALTEHPVVGATLVIDPITVFYKDLLNDLVQEVKNKRGHETLSQSEWTKENRRWFAFLNMLVAIPMHVVLVTREREEYVESVNNRGEEVRKKTGNFIMECDKQTEFLFDVILRLHTEENKKEKTSRHLVTVMGTRYDWLPKYTTYDITKKRAFDEIFAEHVGGMLDAPDAPAVESSEPILIIPEAAALATEPGAQDDPVQPAEPLPTHEEAVQEMNDFFGVTKPDPSQPEATLEDIKVLMTRANEMQWPDDAHKCRKQGCKANGHIHPNFKTADGKSMIRSMYGVESTKELRKPQVEFLHDEFGKVLAGRAFLDRDGQGTVYVATPPGTTEEEVKRNVLAYAK